MSLHEVIPGGTADGFNLLLLVQCLQSKFHLPKRRVATAGRIKARQHSSPRRQQSCPDRGFMLIGRIGVLGEQALALGPLGIMASLQW